MLTKVVKKDTNEFPERVESLSFGAMEQSKIVGTIPLSSSNSFYQNSTSLGI